MEASLPLRGNNMVEFDEVECCAMERASAQEVHQPLIREYMAHIREVHPTYKAFLLLGIFKNAFHVSFVSPVAHGALYASLAFAEKSVLGQKESQGLAFDCEHTIQQHCDALDMVYAKIASSQNIDIRAKEHEVVAQKKIPSVQLNRVKNLIAGSYFNVPRVTHRVAHRKKLPRFKIKCGCCDEWFDIYYDFSDDPAEANLEIANVNASVKDWRAILLPLLGFERQGDAWVDTHT